MSLHFENKDISPKMKAVATAIWNAGLLKGVYIDEENNPEPELAIRRDCCDYYGLSLVMAQRMAAGDFELVERGDSIGRKQYFDQLVSVMGRDSINKAVASSLLSPSLVKGVYTNDENPEQKFEIRSYLINHYRLSIVVAERMAAGDLELVEHGDSIGQKQYCDRLISKIINPST